MAEPTVTFAPDPRRDAREAGFDRALFGPCDADPALRCYLLLDAAASPDIPVCLEGFGADARCLFDGTAGEALGEVAPWLVAIARHQAVTGWYLDEGHGRNWGIVLHTRLEPARLKARLKRFLRVRDEAGEEMFFKFYRPRNLNAVLPALTPDQRAAFLQDIDAILAEDAASPDLMRCHRAAGPAAGELLDLAALALAQPPRDPRDEAARILARLKAAP